MPSSQTIQPEARLRAVAQHLLAADLYPYQIEMRLYCGLTASTPNASLFRAGLGVAAPLSRDSASRLAEFVGRSLRGPRDEKFVSQYVLAHTRNRLMQAAYDAAEDLRRDSVAVTRDNLELAMMMTVGTRRGALIIDNPVRDSIEKRIKFTAADYLEGAR